MKRKEILAILLPKNAQFRACDAVIPLSIAYSLMFRPWGGIVKEDPMNRFTLGPLALGWTLPVL